ncbi:MAG TPA: hypothetical protein VG452_01525, partial [Egibacteraceae bacterium]|nr:hypothetical protein [Egibacteraceae bacterium]
QLTGLSIEQVRPRAGEILQQLAAGRSEPELLEADPTLSPELIRGAAAYGTVLARDEVLPPALPEALDERALRDLLEPADGRLIDDLYRYRHAGRGTLPSPEREYKTWRSLVEEVETGQFNDLDEYLGVYLPRRDLLEEAVSLVSPPSQDRLLGVIRPWDRRFDAATRPVEQALLTRPPWQPLRWWWYRVPKRCGPYMAEALRGRGVL